MKLLSSAVAVLALVSVASCTPGASSASDETEVTSALEAFYTAMRTGDTAAAMSRIAPNALFVESGRLETRDEYEKNHLPADIGFERQVPGTREIQQVTINGDTAWVIATTAYEGTFDGSPIEFISAQLAVLARAEDDRWLIRSIHWSSRRP